MDLVEDVAQGAVNIAANGISDFRDHLFDLQKENHGFFSNLTMLHLILTSLTGGRNVLKGKDHFNQEYDFIVVGAGTAGSVIASRLSEIPCVTVLLLEAGGEAPILEEVPAASRLFHGSDIDWFDKTTPQPYAAFGNKNNQVYLNSGKVLGGSSTLNAMLYVRGNKKNFDDWAADGAKGWSWKEVKPYFLKLEDNRNIEELDPGYHQKGGPMTVEKINYTPEFKYPVLNATAAMGYEKRDINGQRQTGIYELQATVRNQQRCHTAKAYLEPVAHRQNLDIVTYAHARKILIDESRGNVAYGVEFDHLGGTHSVTAKREIIICNGALRTPQLLMLSGIGPREHLEKKGIKVIVDLPVGKNLHDHVASNLVFELKPTIVPYVPKVFTPTSLAQYLTERKGPICAPHQCSILAFLNGLNTTAYSEDYPRQELYFADYDVLDARFKNIKDEVYDAVFSKYVLKPLLIVYSSILQPRSRGDVTLNSTDPYDAPLINPNYYADPRDLEDVVEGMRIADAIARHPAMQEVGAKLIDTMYSGFPGCESYDIERDKIQYFRCIARQLTNTFWHPVGTARMGSRNDPRSVVDPELRVIGVRNLRVVNAAIMPTITSGNTNVPTMMIAEKASDMIKSHVRCHHHRNRSPPKNLKLPENI